MQKKKKSRIISSSDVSVDIVNIFKNAFVGFCL